jgi:alpha-L-arabinofuranosidase
MKAWINRRLVLVCAALLGPVAAFAAADATTAELKIDASNPGPVIDRNIYGQFAEHLGHGIYGGVWVGEDSSIPNTNGYRNDVLAALRELQVPVIRWPGGCFADEYHWRNGIGPMDGRPAMINTNWGGVVENNHFGTHEFLNLCELLGCEPYVCVNVGSGTVQEAAEWIEYMTSDANSPMANLRRKNGRDKPWRVKFVAVGNEAWGCGGDMTPEFYADNFRRYTTYIKNYSDIHIARIASGPNNADYQWTDTVMKSAGKRMQGIGLHYYTWPKKAPGLSRSATEFGEAEWFQILQSTLKMEDLINGHSQVMDRYDAPKRVSLVVDEWGTWYSVEPGTNPGFLYQQNTLRDAIVAGLNLHIFQKHADRVRMANIAQMVNVLQAMILTDGSKMLLTPTYHVFDMFKVHQGATSLPTDLATPDYAFGGAKIPAVSASASRDPAGRIHLSLVNADPSRGVSVHCTLSGAPLGTVTGRVLTAPAMNAHNTFEHPHELEPVAFTGAVVSGGALTVELPAKSVVVLDL